jgi:hypothetical protein
MITEEQMETKSENWKRTASRSRRNARRKAQKKLQAARSKKGEPARAEKSLAALRCGGNVPSFLGPMKNRAAMKETNVVQGGLPGLGKHQ